MTFMTLQSGFRPLAVLALSFLCSLPAVLRGQEVSISQGGTYTGCDFFFVDNGLTAGDASPNADYTMTFCPDLPADPVINFYFNLFALGAGDTLFMWLSDAAVGEPDGVYTGFDLQGVDVWSQMEDADNASGCITWQFTSDATENSNWTAEVICEEPCQRPEANVVTTLDGVVEPVPVQICVDEEVQFDGSGSIAADGLSINSWTWDFDDGATDISGPQVTHSFEEPGAYNVQLFIVDENDCPNGNLVDHLILVSTPTSFDGITQDLHLCAGQEYPVNGVAQGITYDSTPDVDFGGGLFIPDDQTQCFSSSIVFTSFNSGQVVESADDIENLFINFEHSFMGDLTITFICPDGSSMGVHQQGGGGTFLGQPVDNDGTPDTPGVGYDYFWAPDATNGTWADNAGGTLPSGTYESVQPWTLLEGCPLNGTWTVEVCDSWGSDNGFIFDWFVNFEPSLYPDPIIFTPQIGADCDSSFWTGPFIVDQGGACDSIMILPENPGVFDYVYTVTNDFGCTSSDTMVVTVEPGPELNLVASDNWCGVPVGLTATASNPNLDDFNVDWSWTATDGTLAIGSGNETEATATIDDLNSPVNVTVTMNLTAEDIDECLASATIPVGLYPPPAIEPYVVNQVNCFGDILPLLPDVEDSDWDLLYAWGTELDSDGFIVDSLVLGTAPSFSVNSSGTYYFEVSMAPPCIGVDIDSIEVSFGPCVIETIPNIITPNGDTRNDRFEIKGLNNTLKATLAVYNRWGEQVYFEDDYANAWEPDADELAESTYYVVLDVKNYPLSPDDIEHNGVITKGTNTFRYVGPLQILRNQP